MKKAKNSKKKPSLLKRMLTRIVIYGTVIALIASGTKAVAYRHSDDYVFDRVVQIKGEMGSCSGEQVKAPSGKAYILTAGHCRNLVEAGNAKVITEDGKTHDAVFIAEDPKSDLMLLKGIHGLPTLNVAKRLKDRQHLLTYTHGNGFKAYKTEGVAIEVSRIQFFLGTAFRQSEQDKCTSAPKTSIQYIYGVIPVCIMSVDATMSTAFVAPGSSGGAVVDDSGNLVGVVSGNGNGFSAFVRLVDIQNFLSDK